MDDFVVHLNQQNYENIIKTNFGKPIIVLFTERKESSLLYRSLANSY
jgi:hypothetical protein